MRNHAATRKQEPSKTLCLHSKDDVQFTIHLLRDKLVSSQASSCIVPWGIRQMGNRQNNKNSFKRLSAGDEFQPNYVTKLDVPEHYRHNS